MTTKKIFRFFLLVFLGLSTMGLTTCFDSDVDEQSIPWGRPKSWEGGAPGIGSGMR